MRRFLAAAAIIAATFSLSGCDIFYPNWGQTTPPTDDPTATPTETVTPTTEPTVTPTPTKKPQAKAVVRILQSSVDSSSGMINVIAEVADISEDGGFCTLKVTQGAVSRSFTAKAESNVTDTQCYPLNLAITGFASGPADFTVTYDSTEYIGTASDQITIP